MWSICTYSVATLAAPRSAIFRGCQCAEFVQEKHHRHKFQGVMIILGAGRVAVLVDGKLDLTLYTVAITYLSYTSRNALLAAVVVMVYM